MKRKLTFLTIALFANVIMCLAQDSKIKGLLFDKATNEAMAFASVALLQDDGTVVAGAMVNEKGVFEIDAVQGSYKLRASYIGYKEFIDALETGGSIEEAAALCKQHSRNYAKRQLTWFRRDRSIRWLDGSSDYHAEAIRLTEEFLQ